MINRSMDEYEKMVRGHSLIRKSIELRESIDIADVGDIRLGDSKQLGLATLCLDIRNFSRISANLRNTDVVRLLNIYYPVTAMVVADHDGIIDKYPGDGLMAHFALVNDGANRAVHTAKVLMTLVKTIIADELRRATLPSITCGIGLDAGRDTRLAAVGIPEHCEIIAVGDSVNRAAKLEKEARPEGVLLGEGLYHLINWEYRIACTQLPSGVYKFSWDW